MFFGRPAHAHTKVHDIAVTRMRARVLVKRRGRGGGVTHTNYSASSAQAGGHTSRRSSDKAGGHTSRHSSDKAGQDVARGILNSADCTPRCAAVVAPTPSSYTKGRLHVRYPTTTNTH